MAGQTCFWATLPQVGGAVGVSAGAFREWQVDGYFQDDWRVTQNLTLNLGIRYDFDKPPNDKNGHSSIYDLPSNQMITGTWQTNYRDIAPRIGFALAVEQNTTVHGGFGIYYASSPYNFLQFLLLAHPPNFITQSKTLHSGQTRRRSRTFSPRTPLRKALPRRRSARICPKSMWSSST